MDCSSPPLRMFGISSQGFCLGFRLQPQPTLCVPHGRGCERTCSRVKWEHGEQRRVWHLASASTLPRSYYCSKVLLKKHSPTVGNFAPCLKTEMMSGGGMIRRGQDQAHNWRYPPLDQSHSLTRSFFILCLRAAAPEILCIQAVKGERRSISDESVDYVH